MGDSRARILARRSRFVAAAIASSGMVACHDEPPAKTVTTVTPPSPAPTKAPPTDRDGDGILDQNDKCPDDPEDKDGFEDEDGCPDPDNDQDGIPDQDDKCPLQPGPPPYGCPKPCLMIIQDAKPEITSLIFFKDGSSKLLPEGFPILDEIVKTLAVHPTLTVYVEGHASTGEANPKKLSEDRARAVLEALIARGAPKTRVLDGGGFGITKPIDSNTTEPGRAKNRRVSFRVAP